MGFFDIIKWFFEIPEDKRHIRYYKDENKEILEIIPEGHNNNNKILIEKNDS